jgi:hypothetical protein
MRVEGRLVTSACGVKWYLLLTYPRVLLPAPEVSTSIKLTLAELAVDVDREPEIGRAAKSGVQSMTSSLQTRTLDIVFQETDALDDVPRAAVGVMQLASRLTLAILALYTSWMLRKDALTLTVGLTASTAGYSIMRDCQHSPAGAFCFTSAKRSHVAKEKEVFTDASKTLVIQQWKRSAAQLRGRNFWNASIRIACQTSSYSDQQLKMLAVAALCGCCFITAEQAYAIRCPPLRPSCRPA